MNTLITISEILSIILIFAAISVGIFLRVKSSKKSSSIVALRVEYQGTFDIISSSKPSSQPIIKKNKPLKPSQTFNVVTSDNYQSIACY